MLTRKSKNINVKSKQFWTANDMKFLGLLLLRRLLLGILLLGCLLLWLLLLGRWVTICYAVCTWTASKKQLHGKGYKVTRFKHSPNKFMHGTHVILCQWWVGSLVIKHAGSDMGVRVWKNVSSGSGVKPRKQSICEFWSFVSCVSRQLARVSVSPRSQSLRS